MASAKLTSTTLKTFNNVLKNVERLEKRVAAQNKATGKSFTFLGLGAKKTTASMSKLKTYWYQGFSGYI